MYDANMKKHIRRFALYLFSIIIGALLLVTLLPTLVVDVYADQLPWKDSPEAASLFFYRDVVRSFHVLIAASLAAIFGFFMSGNPALRRLTLTMPLWAPILHGILVMAFSLR